MGSGFSRLCHQLVQSTPLEFRRLNHRNMDTKQQGGETEKLLKPASSEDAVIVPPLETKEDVIFISDAKQEPIFSEKIPDTDDGIVLSTDEAREEEGMKGVEEVKEMSEEVTEAAEEINEEVVEIKEVEVECVPSADEIIVNDDGPSPDVQSAGQADDVRPVDGTGIPDARKEEVLVEQVQQTQFECPVTNVDSELKSTSDLSTMEVVPASEFVSAEANMNEETIPDSTPVETIIEEGPTTSLASADTIIKEGPSPVSASAVKEGSVSTSEESSEGREKIAIEKKDVAKMDRVKKEQNKEVKKIKKGRDSGHMTRAISQTLAGLDTPEEKIAALCKKYAELLGEHKSLQREHKAQHKQLGMLQRDRDQLQSEHGRAILAKSKLESLCRELQRHNKTIKEESLQRTKDEEEKRKEVSAKFQKTINEITTQMQDNHTRNLRLKEENVELASKLKKLVEQYERREEHIEKIFKHKELESQLYEAKLQQSNLALQEEQERCKRERTILLHETAEAQTKCEMLMEQDTQLKAQLVVYTEKFEEFQSTLTKSNEIFQTFKQEMDQMTKKIKKLEKETNMWRVRWEKSNKSLFYMAEEKTLREKDLASQKAMVVRLENLCRALQAERNALLGKERALEGKKSTVAKTKSQKVSPVGANIKVDHSQVSGSIKSSQMESNTMRTAPPGTTPESNPVETPAPIPKESPGTSRAESEPVTVDTNVLVNGDCLDEERQALGANISGDVLKDGVTSGGETANGEEAGGSDGCKEVKDNTVLAKGGGTDEERSDKKLVKEAQESGEVIAGEDVTVIGPGALTGTTPGEGGAVDSSSESGGRDENLASVGMGKSIELEEEDGKESKVKVEEGVADQEGEGDDRAVPPDADKDIEVTSQ